MKKVVNKNFEGYIPDFDIAVMDTLLAYQNRKRISGDLLELGTFKGKTASVLNHHCKSGELHLVDLYFHFSPQEWENLNSINGGVNFVLGSTSSDEVVKKLKSIKKEMRFIHCDTSHSYFDTSADLTISKNILSKEGIIAVDDFCNLDYPGVLPSVYSFLIKNRKKFRLFLVTQQKAYICRTEMFNEYSKLCSIGMLKEMEDRGESAYLARTDTHYLSSCSYLGKKSQKGMLDLYGGDEYKHLFN